MNLNKCSRCGCFFDSSALVCPKCAEKDESEITVLKNFLSSGDFGESVSIESISLLTGVSQKNVNRFLENKDVYTTLTNLGLNSSINDFSGNLNINL